MTPWFQQPCKSSLRATALRSQKKKNKKTQPARTWEAWALTWRNPTFLSPMILHSSFWEPKLNMQHRERSFCQKDIKRVVKQTHTVCNKTVAQCKTLCETPSRVGNHPPKPHFGCGEKILPTRESKTVAGFPETGWQGADQHSRCTSHDRARRIWPRLSIKLGAGWGKICFAFVPRTLPDKEI